MKNTSNVRAIFCANLCYKVYKNLYVYNIMSIDVITIINRKEMEYGQKND